MRTIHAIALAAALSFGIVAPAIAQEPITGTTVVIPGEAPRPKLDSETMKDYKGKFLLSNGKTLIVVTRGKRLFAEMDGQAAVELIPSGKNVFVARDSEMMYMFDQMYEGKKTDILIKPKSLKIG
ncbi:hypothetical protein [Massilia cavernae]|uniref:DUF3471 domain-containing protein n=1 Tax=Massilia cavernae TaxID=2320864 RepID=A0A418Y5W4_9BURK|nr:hypothetical protein [Massilia cavernae]RJG22240.1 hypothetical protein D3872_05670 [Massilia cavernae]